MSNSHYSEEFDYKRKNFSFCITYSRLNSHFSFFCVFHAIWMLIQTMEQLVRIFRMEIVTCNFHNYLPLALDIAWARGSHRHILTLHRHTYYDEILDFWGMHHEGKGGTRHHQKSPLFSFLSSQTPVSMTLHSNFFVAPIGTAGEQYSFKFSNRNWKLVSFRARPQRGLFFFCF